MARLIATLGTSPGGIFESYKNLIEGNYQGDNVEKVKIDEVYIIRTSDKAVEFAWKLVKAIFTCCGAKDVRVYDIPLSITDINSRQDFLTFKREVESKINNGDFVDITGGRKSMSVAAAMSARNRNAKIITTVVPQAEYNRVQNLIKQLEPREKEIEMAGEGKCQTIDICQLVSKSALTILLS
ncbi:CRISPR-associated ring nuclease Crn1 [Stygiolobus azoricus]|uniref:CRISPR-associated protein n=1 Tax=Stygiolobus azoricus TaxID=41675 RepID=A0A650CPD6_9CREN|nr:CRISPR-associated ring nuclease Crn1 [Stygiolobus azoricus]QGR19648.1 CRISPR-associated protein [Stygiolobus azoricus]